METLEEAGYNAINKLNIKTYVRRIKLVYFIFYYTKELTSV